MVTSKELNEIIDYTDEKIKEFADQFVILKTQIDSDLDVKVDIHNERTLAYFTTEVLSKKLPNYCNVNNYINEFKIKHPKLTEDEFEKIKDEEVDQTWEKFAYIDAYYNVEDLYGNINHLFVEYKLDNRFDFIKLAQDFLKYKYCTVRNSNTGFVYIIFDRRKDNYPTIISKEKKYVFLDYKIYKETCPSDSRIYIYLGEQENEKYSAPKYIDVYKELNTIVEKMESIQVIPNNIIVKEISCNRFYKSRGILKQRVATANLLVGIADDIDKMYHDAISQQDTKRIFDSFKVDDDLFCDDGTDNLTDNEFKALTDFIKGYFPNLESYYGNENKTTAKNNGLNVSYKTSLSVIVVLKLFAKYNNIEFDIKLPIYNKGKKSETNYNDIADGMAQKIEKYYDSTDFDFNRLGAGILYYLKNLYDLILTNGEERKLSNEYYSVSKYEKMQESIDKIRKELHIQSNINIFADNFKETSFEIVKKIVEK